MILEELEQEHLDLKRRFEDHRHTGTDSQTLTSDTETPAVASTLPRSYPILAGFGDTTTTMRSDDVDRLYLHENGNQYLLFIGGPENYQRYGTLADWASMDNIWGAFQVGDYVYALLQDTSPAPPEFRIYRYEKDNLAAGGTLMTFSGTAPDLTTSDNLRLATDGTNFYLNYDGGNSANAYVIAEYSVSGTVFTYVSSLTCGSSILGFNQGYTVLADGTVYTIDLVSRNLSKFSAAGTLVYTADASTLSTGHEHLSNIEDTLYCYNSNSKHMEKLIYT